MTEYKVTDRQPLPTQEEYRAYEKKVQEQHKEEELQGIELLIRKTEKANLSG